MKEEKEKRECQRHPYEASVRFAFFNQNQFHQAKLLGFSESGISFNSRTPIKVGTTIIIKLEDLSDGLHMEMGSKGLKTISLVETRWCRDVGGEYASEYEVGGKFFLCD